MTAIAIGSLRGAPGATTLALAMSRCWPTESSVVLEADPSGGVLAARLGTLREPGLVTLVASRQETSRSALIRNAVLGGAGVSIVCGPAGSEAANAALRSRPDVLTEALVQADCPVFVDVGRLSAHSPALVLAQRADQVIVAVRPSLDELDHLVAATPWLQQLGPLVSVVLIGDRPYCAHEVRSVLDPGLGLLAALPIDPRGVAELVRGGGKPSLAARRSPYLRAVRELVRSLAEADGRASSPARALADVPR